MRDWKLGKRRRKLLQGNVKRRRIKHGKVR
jgi:hypothetical protein